MKNVIVWMILTVWSIMNVTAGDTVYLFSYFINNSKDGLHLAYSYDGLTWTALNGGRSFLTPTVGKDKLMRDPSICQAPDGTFHMVWTSSWTDRIIGYASSRDLIHWSEQKAIPVMMNEPAAHNCWAPELFYDESSQTYYIFWATTIPGRHKEVPTSESEKGLNHRIYYVTTKDFKSFSKTAMFFNPDFSVIDAAIVKDPKRNDLIMVVKNENSNPPEKNLRVTRTENIRKGFPTKVSAPITGNYWAEGPAPLFIGDTLYVYFDKYRDHRYGAVRSLDHGETWEDVSDQVSFPKGIRHGTTFAVDASVVETLISASKQYTTIKVEAPFPMQPIKEFIYPDKDFVITDYGAKPEGETDNTKAITAAIEACYKAGGGRVVVPDGIWLTGPVHFKSNVNLYLEENAVLSFSDNPKDYLPAVMTSWEGLECYNYSPLLYAFECENVAISGKGTLQPKMGTWKVWFKRPQPHLEALKELYTKASTGVPVEERQMAVGENNLRPHLIHFNRCKNIQLEGFRIRESPFWTIHIYMCDGGVVRNLDVRAHGHNNDGIDFEMSKNFLVENCSFDQGDDAVVIKAGRNQDAWRLNTPCENIVIRNCQILKGHTLLGIGSEISGGIRNVYMHDCTAPNSVMRLFFVKTNHRRGGFVENIYMKDVNAGNVQRVLEIDTEVLYQWKDLVPTYEKRLTRIDGVYMENVACESADAIYELKGNAQLPVENVAIKDVKVGLLRKFVKKVNNVNHLLEKDVTYKME
ncbi:alpha-d-galacturonidase [uncultured Bacteroides sp.]|uniref:alpha-d-galacturonidase n=1 Tax=uncultured Bacteroides sp. TaxID=162156 RepID=UPI000820D139|nr:Exo-poly-alpha-D-galacturonosidase precursor [uncultured Bacteroides sp.]